MRLVSLATALVLVGCADQGDEGMVILNNTAVTGTTCALSGDPGQPFRPRGEIYAGSSIGYTLTPLIQSRVTATIGGGSGAGSGTVDQLQRTIQLRSADVKLTVKAVEIEQGGVFMTNSTERALPPFSALFSGSLPPGGSVNVAFEVITPSMLRDIVNNSGANADQNVKAEVLAEVTIRGEMGGDEVVAQPYFYPISVCTNCVISYLGACPATGTVRTGNACNPFQDGVVDCCTDAANNLICPATAM